MGVRIVFVGTLLKLRKQIMPKQHKEHQKSYRERMEEAGYVYFQKWIPKDKKLWDDIMKLIAEYRG